MEVGKFADGDWAYAYMPMQEDREATGFITQVTLHCMSGGGFLESWMSDRRYKSVADESKSGFSEELHEVCDFLGRSAEYGNLWRPGCAVLSKEDIKRRFRGRRHPNFTVHVDSARYTYLFRCGDAPIHDRDIHIFCYKKEALRKHSEEYFRKQEERVKMRKKENEQDKQNEINKKPAAKIVPAVSPKRSGSISWDEYFMGVAALSAMRSKDPHTQVGCCIVGAKNRIASVGYNGLPFGCDDDEYPWNWHSEGLSENETKYPYVVHSELNAILNYRGESLEGAKMYVTMFPCCECAKAIIQSGIKEVIYRDAAYLHSPSGAAATRMFKSAGVSVRRFGGDKRLIF